MRKIQMNKKTAALIFIACAFLGGVGQLFFKFGASGITFSILSWILNWQLILGLFLYGVGTLVFTFMLKKTDLSFAYPIIATSYIWVAIFSFFILNEAMHLSNWAGIILIIIGGSLATRK